MTSQLAKKHVRANGVARTLLVLMAVVPWAAAISAPYVPTSDDQVLADLPAGARYSNARERGHSPPRLDVALPLTQFYIERARASGDQRFLGYAEAQLQPWIEKPDVSPAVLVLHATILQSRHEFGPALAELDRALGLQPENAQAWLTRATVLRVLGRYPEAEASCARLASAADPAITTLCAAGVRSLTGALTPAYFAIQSLATQELPPQVRAWRYSELGEMAERRGDDAAAEHWLREGLALAPDDFYLRGALADLLLRERRAAETLKLLNGYESMEPMLLRSVLAHKLLHDATSGGAEALLRNAFAVEERRGDVVHRREQARFLLDVAGEPRAALTAALQNWQVQREPEDLLILLRAAQGAHADQAADPARQFLQQAKLQDARVLSFVSAAKVQ